MMVAVLTSFSCNYIPFSFPSLPSFSTSKPLNPNHPSHLRRSSPHLRAPLHGDTLRFHGHGSPAGTLSVRRFLLIRRRSSADEESPGGPTLQEEGPIDKVNGGGGDGGEDWTTSVLLFVLWAGLMYYIFQLTPDQTPILTAAGLGLILYAGLAPVDDWKEFFQYFKESKFIHITSLDFSLLSAFSGFWVYNDMTARKWFDKGSWLLPLALVPFIGPALYLLLRPPLSEIVAPVSSSMVDEE